MNDNFIQVELNNTTWEIPKDYQFLKILGAGAYGQVCSAQDYRVSLKDGRDVSLRPNVAIKKLTNPFRSVVHAKRMYRELRLLKHMNHENIIGLLDVFTPVTTLQNFKDVYLVTTLMEAGNLSQIVKTQSMSDEIVQFLVYQILRGIKYIHSAGIIHRDLKPLNMAVNEDWELRILDFGLARCAESEMTGYVATRWYRAPEIMLNWMNYHQTVDIWSVGCIMAEMLTGKPLFPGNDTIDQLTRILGLCGSPNEEMLKKMTSKESRRYIQSLPQVEKKNFNEEFKGCNPLAIDLLEKTLELDADKRITAEQALSHEYLSIYSDPDDEPNSTPYDQTFEDLDLSIEQWREYVWKELQDFRRPQ